MPDGPTMSDYTKLGMLPDLFKSQALKTPHQTAVVSQNAASLTYAELDDVTDRLAKFLRLKGVVPDSCVGIYMEKSLEYVISYIAILKAGGAYLPLDMAYPSRLLHDILIDACPKYILSKRDLICNLESMQGNCLDMTGQWMDVVNQQISSAPAIPERPEMTLDNLAYIVYSSGTTGKPKGIQCPHRGAVYSYTWRHDYYPYIEGDREACNVFFVWEMFRPLCKGAILYVIPDNIIYDPPQLCQFIRENKITRTLFTPSLFETIIEYNLPNVKECFETVRQIWFCGEVVTTFLLDRSTKMFPWIQFVNLYSISEAHDVAGSDLTQYYEMNKGDITSRKYCPVGRVLPDGVKVYIMAEDLVMKPVGVAGEIYIGGPTLARGYLNRPDLDRDRFVPAPKALQLPVGSKLYKAGDWGYLLSDGSLEICGRCDSMHKVRGYSIEVQAIEAAMLDLPMVSSCVILVEGDEGEDKFLVSYIVAEYHTSKREIREALKKMLPFYMIPSYFIFLQSIPVLPASGKLNKSALPSYNSQESANGDFDNAVTTDTERQLLPMWWELLGSKHIDVQESFFDLGGHSLLAAKLLSRLSNELGIQLTVQDLFRHPTITSMAKLIDRKKSGEDITVEEKTILDVNLNKEVDKHDQATLINRPLAHVQSLGDTSMDMQLRAFWRMFNYRPNWRTGSVLLTGSTGFLGAFLIRDLITNTQAHIHCVVRTSANDDPLQRVIENLAKYKLIDNKTLTEDIAKERISCLTGDISLLRMGLSQEDYSYLLTEIDFIVHAAAYVNLLYPYHALHAANVMGTENIIVFACTGKIKPIHYVSTDAVFPHAIQNAKENSDMTQYGDRLTDGYSQTKWVAEQIVLKAAQRGLPVAVYRCGNISGDSRTAAWNRQDFVLGIIQALSRLECVPDIDWELEFTPVDFVTQVIVQLTQKVSLAFGKVFHLIQPKRLSVRQLADWMNDNGYRVKTVSFENWLEQLSSSAGKEVPVIHRLLGSAQLAEETLTSKRTFKNGNLFYILPELDLQYPGITDTLLHTYFTGLRAAKLIAEKTTMSYEGRPLQGMVAIVTGSSSGIGEAIARHLACAGAKVALGARRQDKLEELKAKIIEQGFTARYTVCDVTKSDQVKRLVTETEAEFGPVDILVNNAGVMYYTTMLKKHEDEWERQIDINCKGVVNGVGAVIDGMTSRKSGHIINMSSNAGRRGFAGLAVYSGTKFFVEGFSQALRHEMVEYNVKVTTVQPGDVKTELLSHSTDQEAKDKYDGSTLTPILTPDDLGRAVVYIASQPKNVAINELLVEPAGAPI